MITPSSAKDARSGTRALRRWVFGLILALTGCSLVRSLDYLEASRDEPLPSSDGSPTDAASDSSADADASVAADSEILVIATGQTNARAIVAVDDGVAWVTSQPSGSVVRGAVGRAPSVLAANQASPIDLAWNLAAGLVWANAGDGTVHGLAELDGGASRLVTTVSAVVSVSIDEVYVFASDGTLNFRVDHATNTKKQITNGGGRYRALVPGAGGRLLFLADTGVLYCQPDLVCDFVTRIADPSLTDLATFDGISLFFTRATDPGEITTASLPGDSSSSTFAGGQARPGGIAVDAKHVYWTTRGSGASDGKVLRRALSGAELPLVLADRLASPTSIAVSGDHVYWTNIGDGTVMARRKPTP